MARLYDIPSKNNAPYLLVIQYSGKVDHYGTLEDMEQWRTYYFEDRGIHSCIFRNTEKGIERAAKYADF